MVAPFAAVDPEPSKFTVSGADPRAVEEEMTAVGGVAGVVDPVAVTVVEAMLVWPLESVIVNCAVYVPAVVYVWLAVFPVAVEPSPNSQLKDEMLPVEDARIEIDRERG
jgi:hypothetical protein